MDGHAPEPSWTPRSGSRHAYLFHDVSPSCPVRRPARQRNGEVVFLRAPRAKFVPFRRKVPFRHISNLNLNLNNSGPSVKSKITRSGRQVMRAALPTPFSSATDRGNNHQPLQQFDRRLTKARNCGTACRAPFSFARKPCPIFHPQVTGLH